MHNLQIMGLVYGSGIIERYNLTASTSLVLMALCFHYNVKRNDSFPSQELIASKTNLSKSSLVRAIKQLLQAGLILKTKNKYGNLYKFTQKFFDELNLTPDTIQNENYENSKRNLHDNKENNNIKNKTILNKNTSLFKPLNKVSGVINRLEYKGLRTNSNHAQIEHMLKYQYWKHIPSGKTLKALPDVGTHLLIKYHKTENLIQFLESGLIDRIENFKAG